MKEQRIELLKKYIDENPDEPFNHYALAMEYKAVQAEKALGILDQLTQQHPDYHAAYYHKAELERMLDRYDEAKASYQKGMEVCRQKGESKLLRELQSAYDELLFELGEI